MSPRRLLVIQAAGLGYEFLHNHGLTSIDTLSFRPLMPPFPAVTCTVQASFRTGLPPQSHGMVANGLYYKDLRRPLFWEQSSALVEGPRIWERWREKGRTVGMICWQQSMGESADVVLSPAPIHKHGGGLIDACYTVPDGLYDRLCAIVGRRFRLHNYWGPFASVKSADWIAQATAALMKDPHSAPDLLLTYLPTLDYDLQRYGPNDRHAVKALSTLVSELNLLMGCAKDCGYDVLIYGDYPIVACGGKVCFPNVALREQQLLSLRTIQRRSYPDFHRSKAFAVVDHEIAHVYLHQSADRTDICKILAAYPGVGEVIEGPGRRDKAIDHPNAGDIILVAAPGYWFAYPWWTNPSEAPDYDAHVDIHNKPGFDPAELFLGWPPMTVSRDFNRIRGTHGAVGPRREAAWAATCDIGVGDGSTHLIDLATAVKGWLDHHS